MDDDPHELRNRINDSDASKVRDHMHRELLRWMNENRDPFRGFIWDRREWGQTSNIGWSGPYRRRPDDGAWPKEYSYGTGKLLDP